MQQGEQEMLVRPDDLYDAFEVAQCTGQYVTSYIYDSEIDEVFRVFLKHLPDDLFITQVKQSNMMYNIIISKKGESI